ncbi:hypothetical protein C8R42DRAFT_717908 [Lentinula raphanica]|nr:hypothetical protein C8R42DRAFT_717908 [Lentinula raphanica]
MASSSKASSSKKKLDAPPARIKKSYLFPADALIPDSPTAASPLSSFSFNKDVRPAGGTLATEGVLFLPATLSESKRLQDSWKRFPNSFSSAFDLPRYSSPETADLSTTLFLDTSKQIPSTYYPRSLVRLVDSFSKGPATRSEGYLLYQAIASLQVAVSHIVHKHASKTRNRELLLEMLESDRITACLDHYRSFWHRGQDCPLFAALFMALFCDYCENLLSTTEYREYLYDEDERTGGGMSKRSRRQIKSSFPDVSVTLTSLAIPLPLDPSTKEGQLIITVCHRGPPGSQLIHPFSKVSLLPDPSGFIRALPRSLTPADDSDSDHSAGRTQPSPKKRRPPPAAYSDIELDDDDYEADTPDPHAAEDSEPIELEIPKIRESIARAAKARGRGGTSKTELSSTQPFVQIPAKRERQLSPTNDTIAPEGPPAKKKKSQKVLGKSRAVSPSTSVVPTTQPADSQRLRIQEGPPDYFDDDDTRDPGLALMLPNPDFTITTGFASVLLQSSNVRRGARPPLLRPPKFLIADELKELGAFLSTPEVTFSLPALSRYNYLTSRHLRTLNSRTLPAHTSMYSTSNCLTCLSRGLVCEGGSKSNGSCNNCEATHRTCPSCLGLEDHQDRFRAIHQAVQGFPVGYANAVDAFEKALDRYIHLQTSFEALFADARQDLSEKMRNLRAQGFDANVVLSHWAEENPNTPVDFETISWLSTLFGWHTSCNVSKFLSSPSDIEKLEAFLRQLDPEPPTPANPPPQNQPSPSKTPASSGPVVGTVRQPVLKSKHRPAAAVPVNFPLRRAFQTPSTSSAPPPSATAVDEESENEEEPAQATPGRSLLAEYEGDEDEDAEAD